MEASTNYTCGLRLCPKIVICSTTTTIKFDPLTPRMHRGAARWMPLLLEGLLLAVVLLPDCYDVYIYVSIH